MILVNESLNPVNESLILVNESLNPVNESLILVNESLILVVFLTNR
ncbi:DNA polymerase III alpha subunit [Nostoc flagelliforme CCNUN1]|uniref:DNA polymerase III alpha subunit n=1 Tax=Nostoc flagelliforme CCNUN1 TaxID=2038116 RepID=A0A2K8T1V3_9NOSO|nr:DNA polymerase III alpha subunit [Nostoc flagelliforme CCNUN1]